MPDYIEEAFDQTKKGGDLDKAAVLALLAIAQALQDIAAEMTTLGTEAYPLVICPAWHHSSVTVGRPGKQ